MLRRVAVFPARFSPCQSIPCSSKRFVATPAPSKSGQVAGELNHTYQPIITHIIENRRWFSLQDLLNQIKLEGFELNKSVYFDLHECLQQKEKTTTLAELENFMRNLN